MAKRVLLLAIFAFLVAAPAYTQAPPVPAPRCHMDVDINWDDQTFTVTGTCRDCDILLNGWWEFIDDEMVEICLQGSIECPDMEPCTIDVCKTLPGELLNMRVLRRTSHLTVALLMG